MVRNKDARFALFVLVVLTLLFGASITPLAATIRADNLDVDSMTLVAGTPTGVTTAVLSSTISDLLAFHRGEISGSECFTRLSNADL